MSTPDVEKKAAKPKKKRVSKKWMAQLTDEQKLARRRRQYSQQKKRERKRMTLADRRERARIESKRCFDLTLLMPKVEKESEEGCWIWRGPFKQVFGDVRPLICAGQYGKGYADVCLYTVVTSKKVDFTCTLARTCGRPECVAPHHGRLTNGMVERAIQRHQQQGGSDEPKEGRAAAGVSGPELRRADDDAEPDRGGSGRDRLAG